MLFIIGDHSSGKTKLVKDCLVRWFGQDSESHYVDVACILNTKLLMNI